MAWIESHQSLARHPKTKRLARLAEISLPTAIGHLHLLWWWAVDYAEDGNLDKFSDEDIGDACLWEGDASEWMLALQQAGFIDPDRVIHDWDDYTGRLLDVRRQNAERKRLSRARHAPVTETFKDVTLPSQGYRTQQNPTQQNPTEPNQERELAPQAPRTRKVKKPVEEVLVDEAFRERMRQKYKGILSEIDQRIDEALDHVAASKRPNKQLYVQGWLRTDAERNGAKPNGTAKQNPEGHRVDPSWIGHEEELARLPTLQELHDRTIARHPEWLKSTPNPILPTDKLRGLP